VDPVLSGQVNYDSLSHPRSRCLDEDQFWNAKRGCPHLYGNHSFSVFLTGSFKNRDTGIVPQVEVATSPVLALATAPAGRIEIELSSGHRITTEGEFDVGVLARFLDLDHFNNTAIQRKAHPC
jgi:hypothetical protein